MRLTSDEIRRGTVAYASKLLHAAGERKELPESVETGAAAAVHEEIATNDEVAVEITGNTRLYTQQFKSLPRSSPITARGDDARLVV
jgi:hypothetical protein